mgnify:CR=1 FL=1
MWVTLRRNQKREDLVRRHERERDREKETETETETETERRGLKVSFSSEIRNAVFLLLFSRSSDLSFFVFFLLFLFSLFVILAPSIDR